MTVFLPFLAAYRLVLLLLRADVLAAAHQLDLMWPQMQALRAGSVPLLRQRSPIVAYSLSVTAATGAMVACFRLAGSSGIGEGWSTALYVAGAILTLLSLVLFIALILTSLGFESGK